MSTRIRLLALMLAVTGALLSVPAAVATGGHHAGRAAGHEHFLGLSNNANSNTNSPVLGFGVIHAKGVDKVLSAHKDHFVFPRGTVTVVHQRIGRPVQRFDRRTCYGTFTEHGTWKATGGTRAYASISGGGTYRVHGVIVGCNQHRPPQLFQLQINAVGNLTF